MSRLLVLSLLVLALVHPVAARADAGWARAGGLGIGLQAGSNTRGGLTGKFIAQSSFGVQAHLSFGRHGLAQVSAEALWLQPAFVDKQSIALNWYPGVGAGVDFGDDAVGLVGVLGLGLQVKPAPLEFVVEVRPVFGLGVGFDLQWMLAGRYYLP